MKYPKMIKKMMGLMLASISVGALAFAPVSYAAPTQETLDASGVTRINVIANAKTVKIEKSSDNSIHVSSAVRAVKSGNTVIINFNRPEEAGLIQLPTSLTEASLMMRAMNTSENITINDVALKSIEIINNRTISDIAISNVSVPTVKVQSVSANIAIDAKGLKSAYAFSNQGNVTVKTDVSDITGIVAKSIYGNVEVTMPTSIARSTENSQNNDKVIAYSVQGKAEIKTK